MEKIIDKYLSEGIFSMGNKPSPECVKLKKEIDIEYRTYEMNEERLNNILKKMDCPGKDKPKCTKIALKMKEEYARLRKRQQDYKNKCKIKKESVEKLDFYLFSLQESEDEIAKVKLRIAQLKTMMDESIKKCNDKCCKWKTEDEYLRRILAPMRTLRKLYEAKKDTESYRNEIKKFSNISKRLDFLQKSLATNKCAGAL